MSVANEIVSKFTASGAERRRMLYITFEKNYTPKYTQKVFAREKNLSKSDLLIYLLKQFIRNFTRNILTYEPTHKLRGSLECLHSDPRYELLRQAKVNQFDIPVVFADTHNVFRLQYKRKLDLTL